MFLSLLFSIDPARDVVSLVVSPAALLVPLVPFALLLSLAGAIVPVTST